MSTYRGDNYKDHMSVLPAGTRKSVALIKVVITKIILSVLLARTRTLTKVEVPL